MQTPWRHWLKSFFLSRKPPTVRLSNPVGRAFRPRLDILEDRLAPAGTPIGTIATTVPTFNWPAVAGADHYYLWVSDQLTGEVAVNIPHVNATSFTLSSPLALGHNYQWWAGATRGATTFWGDGVGFTITPTANTPAGNVSTSQPVFNWQAVTGADHYYLWVEDRATGQVVVNLPNLTGTSYTPSAPLAMGAYTWWIGAAHGQAVGWSQGQQFAIEPALGPSGMITTNLPTFTWTGIPGADRYYLWVTDQTTGEVVIDNANLTGSSFTPAQPFTLGHQYMWWIGAIQGQTTSWNAGLNFTIGPTAIAPSGVLATNPPTFTWSSVPGVSHYEVFVSDLATGLWADQVVAGTSWTPSRTFTSGHTYRWWVRAAGGGWGEAHLDLSVPLPQPIAPGGFIGSANAPVYSWTGVPGVTRYELYAENSVSGESITEIVTGTTWVSPYSHYSGNQYRWWIRALDSDMWSSGQGYDIALPTLIAPASAAASVSPTFTWTSVAGINKYELYVYDLTDGSVLDVVVTGTSYTPTTPLRSGHQYRWWVQALEDDGIFAAGEWSPFQDFTVA